MSRDWVSDIEDMHRKYGFNKRVDELTPEMMREYLQFRIRFLEEELTELKESKSAEDVVDALIDLCVVAIGTLDLMNVNAYRAWDEVMSANMRKEAGVKANRPNPFNLPDLTKPRDWQAPSHEGNHGWLSGVFNEK